MKTFGDLTKEDIALVEELEVLEIWFNLRTNELPMLLIAKGLTGLAFEYYHLNMEEEGERILKAVDKRCPQYFAGPVYSHMSHDAEFGLMMRLFKKTQANDLLNSLGFGE